MGRIVVVAYTPKAGKEKALNTAVKNHLAVLRAENLVTDRPATVMRAGDGSLIEVFEWRSADAIDQAHNNASVQALWEDFGEACEFTPLRNLAETEQMFAEFDSVEL